MPAYGNQKDYAIIHLFFHMAIELQLVRKVSSNNQMILTIHKQRLSSFESLTDSEKHVTLLETFWTKLDWKTLQRGPYPRTPNNIDALFDYLNEFPAGEILIVKDIHNLKDFIEKYDHFLYFFDCFGLWKFEINNEISYQKDSDIKIVAKSIELTTLFKTLHENPPLFQE